MWSKKKKKKEGKAIEGPPAEKPNFHNPPKGGVASVSPSNHQSSSSSSYRNESTDPQYNSSCTDTCRPLDGVLLPNVSRQRHSLGPPHSLSVPLPPAPLSTTSILESLNSSLADGGSVPAAGSTDERLHFKQVIAKAQRSLIEEITQTLGKGRGGREEVPMVASITGRPTQSFDYGNQSNKGLEEKAAAQLYDKDKDCI